MIGQIIGDALMLDSGCRLKWLPIAAEQGADQDKITWFDEDGQLLGGTRHNPAHVAAWQDWHRREGWEIPGEKNGTNNIT